MADGKDIDKNDKNKVHGTAAASLVVCLQILIASTTASCSMRQAEQHDAAAMAPQFDVQALACASERKFLT